MKKVLLSLAALLLVSCGTPCVNQVEVYGVVEDVVILNNHYKLKVWCQSKAKYYKVVTNRHYNIGDVVRIR